jgi:chromosome segregation ATPase
MVFVAGCPPGQQPVEVVLRPDTPDYQSNTASKRFEKSLSQGSTAVESAIKLSEKYSQLAEEMAQVKQKNHDLTAENQRLNDRLALLEPELRQAKKELAEANDLLVEMRIELNNWKTDVLGFREEMRDAEIEQLRALLKILEILGGEVKPESDQNQQDTSDAPPTSAEELRVTEIPIAGEPNE